jgi:type II secretory pathway predicted ATPase ExeA
VYLKHFGFKRKPFVAVPDPRELFQARGHQEARSRLKIALHDRVPSLLLGESGVGKSTSSRSALGDLDKREYRLIEIPDPRLELRSFYRILATGLGLQPRFFFGDLAEQVREALAQAAKKGRHPVLFVDDAQMLNEHTLDSLRLLTNPLLDQTKPGITLLLVGDTTLAQRLRRPRFEAFVQRLRMTYRMPAIDSDEGRRYVAHRLRTAGANPDVFDPEAVDELLAAADGRLRKIDDLCVQVLYAAFIGKAKVVSKDHVDAVLTERALEED